MFSLCPRFVSHSLLVLCLRMLPVMTSSPCCRQQDQVTAHQQVTKAKRLVMMTAVEMTARSTSARAPKFSSSRPAIVLCSCWTLALQWWPWYVLVLLLNIWSSLVGLGEGGGGSFILFFLIWLSLSASVFFFSFQERASFLSEVAVILQCTLWLHRRPVVKIV